MRSFICLFLLLTATSIEARMYQWVNPTTGNSQMSGKAPAWYRSETGGPRILVFENNVLVDDTAVYVSDEQRVLFRDEALNLEPSEQKRAHILKRTVTELKAKIDAIVESTALEEYLKSPVQSQLPDQTSPSESSNTLLTETTDQKIKVESPNDRIERLKLLISAWDKNRTEEAKSLLESEASAVKEDLNKK